MGFIANVTSLLAEENVNCKEADLENWHTIVYLSEECAGTILNQEWLVTAAQCCSANMIGQRAQYGEVPRPELKIMYCIRITNSIFDQIFDFYNNFQICIQQSAVMLEAHVHPEFTNGHFPDHDICLVKVMVRTMYQIFDAVFCIGSTQFCTTNLRIW